MSGALCYGNALPPRARTGFGVLVRPHEDVIASMKTDLTAGLDTFYPCLGELRCPGEQCDCLEGLLEINTILDAMNGISNVAEVQPSEQPYVYLPMRCNVGYVANSPLCALCDHGLRFVNTLGECTECQWDEWVYLVLPVTIVHLWFPIMALLTETCESLDIIFNLCAFNDPHPHFLI
jgi:hypothetical protein